MKVSILQKRSVSCCHVIQQFLFFLYLSCSSIGCLPACICDVGSKHNRRRQEWACPGVLLAYSSSSTPQGCVFGPLLFCCSGSAGHSVKASTTRQQQRHCAHHGTYITNSQCESSVPDGKHFLFTPRRPSPPPRLGLKVKSSNHNSSSQHLS